MFKMQCLFFYKNDEVKTLQNNVTLDANLERNSMERFSFIGE